MKQVAKAWFAVALLLSLAIVPAAAQVYNPNTPTAPAPILPVTPSQAVPHTQPIPPVIGQSSRTDPLSARPGIQPGLPSRETHNDRSTRCAHQAASAGLAGGAAGRYVGECVTN
jgi:uncharacterized protein (DUF3084 family)